MVAHDGAGRPEGQWSIVCGLFLIPAWIQDFPVPELFLVPYNTSYSRCTASMNKLISFSCLPVQKLLPALSDSTQGSILSHENKQDCLLWSVSKTTSQNTMWLKMLHIIKKMIAREIVMVQQTSSTHGAALCLVQTTVRATFIEIKTQWILSTHKAYS